MFKLTLSPTYNPDADALTVATAGYVITVNGIEYDFNPLGEGDSLPAGALPEPFTGGAHKVNGYIHLAVLFAYGDNATQAMRFPEPIMVEADGPVQLPEPVVPAAEQPQGLTETPEPMPKPTTVEPPTYDWHPTDPISEPLTEATEEGEALP